MTMKYTALILFALVSASPALAQSSLDSTVHADPKTLPDVCMVMDQVGVVNGISAEVAAKTPGMIFPCSMSDDDMLQAYFAAHMAPAPGGGWRSK
jgi:hypothetical protein